MDERLVPFEAIQDALGNPLDIKPIKYDTPGRPSFVVIGEKATISINPKTGKITTTYPTHTKTAQKLLRKQKDVPFSASKEYSENEALDLLDTIREAEVSYAECEDTEGERLYTAYQSIADKVYRQIPK